MKKATTKTTYLNIQSRFNKSFDNVHKKSGDIIQLSSDDLSSDKQKLNVLQEKITRIKNGLNKHKDFKNSKDVR